MQESDKRLNLKSILILLCFWEPLKSFFSFWWMRKFYSDKRRTLQINPNNQELYFRPKSKKKNKVATKETHSFNSHPNKQQIHPKTGEIQSPKATQSIILDGTLTFFLVQQHPASNALQIPFSLQQPPGLFHPLLSKYDSNSPSKFCDTPLKLFPLSPYDCPINFHISSSYHPVMQTSPKNLPTSLRALCRSTRSCQHD